MPDSNCKCVNVKLPTSSPSLGIFYFILCSSCAENLRGRPLFKFTMMEHWFSINRLICMGIYLCLWILWKHLPLTLEIWYRALIWWECSTDALGIFCCVCLPYHLILGYIIYYILNKLCKGCSSIGKLVFILFRISIWGIEPISSTCLGHLHLKNIVEIIKFIISGTLVLEKVCLNYEIQLAWDIFTWKSLLGVWNSTFLGHFHLKRVCLHCEYLHLGHSHLKKNCLNY